MLCYHLLTYMWSSNELDDTPCRRSPSSDVLPDRLCSQPLFKQDVCITNTITVCIMYDILYTLCPGSVGIVTCVYCVRRLYVIVHGSFVLHDCRL